MRMTNIHEERAQQDFAERAAAAFKSDPNMRTYDEVPGDPEPGQLFAVRWGVAGQAVLVVKLDDCHEPTVYMDMGCDLPK